LFYALLPCVAYAMLVLTAVVALDHAREALFGVGAAVLLLLFVAIHNCWDSVTYHVFVNLPKEEAAPRGRESSPATGLDDDREGRTTSSFIRQKETDR